jgi:hypothetical protein
VPTVALKRLFCGDGTGQIGKKRHTAKLLGFKPALGGTAGDTNDLPSPSISGWRVAPF